MRVPSLIFCGLFALSAHGIEVTRTPIEREVWRGRFTIERSVNRDRLARAYLNARGVRIAPDQSPWNALPAEEQHLLAVREAIEHEVDRLVAGAWRTGEARAKSNPAANEWLPGLLRTVFGDAPAARATRTAFGARLDELTRATAAAPFARGEELDVHVDKLADALTRLLTRAKKAAEQADVERLRTTTAGAVKIITEAYVIESRVDRGRAARLPLRAALDRWRRTAEPGVVDRFWSQVRRQSLDYPRHVVSIAEFAPHDGPDEIFAGIVGELAQLADREGVVEACARLLTAETAGRGADDE